MQGRPSSDRLSARVSRRRLLQVGTLGLLGLDLPQFLQAKAADASERRADASCIPAVAYASCNQFDQAVEQQKLALQDWPWRKRTLGVERLKLFEQHKPYRRPPVAVAPAKPE